MRTIHDITLDERTVVHHAPHIESERSAAINDLLADNYFALKARQEQGKYGLHLRVADQRLFMDVMDKNGAESHEIAVPLKPFKMLIRDYFLICESYLEAVKSANHTRIEAIDMGRRGIHNEGSELLMQYLAKEVEMDMDTARRLFTLICVLHIR